MTQARNLKQVTEALTSDELLGVLLEMTGDLDKALVLEDTLPGWLVTASPQLLRKLQTAQVESQRFRERAQDRLKRLTPLKDLCAERLEAFLASKGFGHLDVEHDEWVVPRRTLTGVGPFITGQLIEIVKYEQQPLLQAAMQNFSLYQSGAGGMPSATFVKSAATKQAVPGLNGVNFVEYCRELDLGGLYQRHIREVFNLTDPADGAVDTSRGFNAAIDEVGNSRVMDMQIDLHIACAKGDVSPSTYKVLLEVVAADRPASEVKYLLLGQQPLNWHGLNIDGACLWSVLVLASSLPDGPLLVYMPNEPVRPWFEYPTLGDFKAYLTLKLQVASYRQFFGNYLAESERLGFFQRFDKDRTLGTFEWLPTTLNFTTLFFNAGVGRIQLDALELAVPTAQVDEDARAERLQKYLDAGLTVLNVASFVVPVLGELMMGVAVGQLLGEVYDGIEDWYHGEKNAALEHLINVAENVGSMLLFAAGGRVVGTLKRSLTRSPLFFDQMEAVTLADQKPRLWRRRLQPYRERQPLDDTVVANPRGIYQDNGRHYAKVDGVLYEIGYDAEMGKWRIRHPQREKAYRPALNHNGQGGWIGTFERPESWNDPVSIVKRLDPRLDSIPPSQLREINAITGIDVPELQALALDAKPLPGRFRDCVMRYRQHEKVLDLIGQLALDTPPAADTAPTQLHALPLMSGWPEARFFELLDSDGSVIRRYPETAPFDYEDLSIHITQQQVKDGQVMQTLLAELNDEERLTLLGGTVEEGKAQATLQRQLLASVKRHHQALYEKLCEDFQVTPQGDHGLLRTRYPSLANGVAWELMARSSTLDRWHLRNTGRVPLLLAQRAGESLQALEQDQALMGVYYPELAGEGTHRVVVGMLGRLSGWPANVFLRLRSETLTGRVLGQVGGESAALQRTIVVSAEGFQAYDGTGTALGTRTKGPKGLYQAALNSLSARQRTALQLGGEQGPDQLRRAVVRKVQDDRARAISYLSPEPPPEAEPITCVQASPPEPAAPGPAALVRKVRRLYPAFRDQQVSTLLERLGTDHLSRAKAVRALQQQFGTLHQALRRWCKDTSAAPDRSVSAADFRISRLRAMSLIEDSWQHLSVRSDEYGGSLQSLRLDSLRLGKLPSLPPGIDFGHVQCLSLVGMNLNDDMISFLKYFKGVRDLDLSSNQIRRLPEVLSHMPALERLRMADNQLQLSEYTRTKLADLRSLKVLDLSKNPLLNPPDVSKMFDLQQLDLRDCQLQSFPEHLLRLPYLTAVHLEGNAIAQLPGWLFKVHRRFAQGIFLNENPLDASSKSRLEAYQEQIGSGMGYLGDNPRRLEEQAARAAWLPSEGEPHYGAKTATWAALYDDPASEGLFQLLAQLPNTADARLVREDMTRRVWRVLNAIETDATLRAGVLLRAHTPINCDDNAAVNFSALELKVEIHETARGVEGGQLTVHQLLNLGRGMYRLKRLKIIADRFHATHPGTDPMSVDLAYRTGLSDRFYLPGQPKHFIHSSIGGVSTQDLDDAEHELKTAELSADFKNFLVAWPIWQKNMKRLAAQRFETLNQPFHERQQALFETSGTLKDAEYLEQAGQIGNEQAQAQKQQIERMTEDEIKNDELGLCSNGAL